MARNLHEAALAEVRDVLAKLEPGENEVGVLNSLLRISARWRSEMIANTIEGREGAVVRSGPFAGMKYLPRATEGGRAPRLLGCYEAELHPHLEALIASGPREVVDIGCAEGYYAVGMALRLPQAVVYAHDTSAGAQAACGQLAALNGVSERVMIGGEFRGEDFERFADAVFIVDIEGAEGDLLDPERWPALRNLRLVVETHPGLNGGVTRKLIERFSPSHRVTLARQSARTPDLPEWFGDLGQLDALLAAWEWRATPTPWLVMAPERAAGR